MKIQYIVMADVKKGFTIHKTTTYTTRRLYDVRSFKDFYEAQECAKRISSGKFENWPAGEYINNR